MGVFASDEILRTVEMVHKEHLDVRTVTLGINVLDCADSDPKRTQRSVFDKIVDKAQNLIPVCDEIARRYGIPIVNKRPCACLWPS